MVQFLKQSSNNAELSSKAWRSGSAEELAVFALIGLLLVSLLMPVAGVPLRGEF